VRKFIEKEDGKFYEIITCSDVIDGEIEDGEIEVETSIRDFPIGSHIKFAHFDYWCEIGECNSLCTFWVCTFSGNCAISNRGKFMCRSDLRIDGKSVIAKRIEGK
jgi:hypothetical protein